MARDFKHYEVFISSPSDVMMEREIIQEAIEQVNQIRGAREGFKLIPILWEKDVSSQFGSPPQEIINEQIGDQYDIFIGILCNRFGQKTEDYDSGTEEEFFKAYERCVSEENGPEISFFFKDPRRSETPIDAEQFLKVSNFKLRLTNLGVYEDFETQESLKTKAVVALSKAIDRLKTKTTVVKVSDIEEPQESSSSAETGSSLVLASDFDEDIGLIELTEIVFDGLENSTETLNVIGAATKNLGAKFEARTAELLSLKQTGNFREDNSVRKPIIEKAAAEMQRYSHILDQNIPNARREFSSALRGMQHAVIISNQDDTSNTDDNKVLVDQLEEMQSVLTSVHGQTSNFRDIISGTPRMTSKLNQAKRRTLKSLNDLLDFLSEANANISTTLKAIQS